MLHLHVVCDRVVIGSRPHAAIVIGGREMVDLEPHTHVHGVELGREVAIGGVDVVAEVFGHLYDLVW